MAANDADESCGQEQDDAHEGDPEQSFDREADDGGDQPNDHEDDDENDHASNAGCSVIRTQGLLLDRLVAIR